MDNHQNAKSQTQRMPELHTTHSADIIFFKYFTPRDSKLLAGEDHVRVIFSVCSLVPGPVDVFLMRDLKIELGEKIGPLNS